MLHATFSGVYSSFSYVAFNGMSKERLAFFYGKTTTEKMLILPNLVSTYNNFVIVL